MIDISKQDLRLVQESQIDFHKINSMKDLESENKTLKTGLILFSVAVVFITGIIIINHYSQEKDS